MQAKKLFWLALIVAVGVVVMYGRSSAPPRPTAHLPDPADVAKQVQARLAALDPQRRMVVSVRQGPRLDELTVTVTNAFHRQHEQERLQFVQAVCEAWRQLGRRDTMAYVVDLSGNIVGAGSSRETAWAKRY